MKRKKSGINLGISAVAALILILFDQLTKYLAILFLKGKEDFTVISNVFKLEYLENTSAAFGIDLVTIIRKVFHIQYWYDNQEAFLRAKMIFFVVVTILVLLLLCYIYTRIPQGGKFKILNILFVLFISGAIGNLIDRIIRNFVVDFFYFELINFPVFNVADIYVTVAAFLFIVLGIFYYKESDIEEIFPHGNKKENN